MNRINISIIKIVLKSLLEGTIIAMILLFGVILSLFVYAFVKETSVILPFNLLKISGQNYSLQFFISNNFPNFVGLFSILLSIIIFIFKYYTFSKKKESTML